MMESRGKVKDYELTSEESCSPKDNLLYLES